MTVARASLSSLNRGPSKKRTFLAGNDPILSGAFESIATVNLNAAQATVTFSSIPQTYKHLQIRLISRNSTAGNVNASLKLNNDTAGNYVAHYLSGDGSTAGAGYTGTNVGPTLILRTANGSASSGIFGVGIIDILDYSNTNKNKTTRSLSGADQNGSGSVMFISNLWMSTSAITQIDITADSTFAQYSHFALYGIR